MSSYFRMVSSSPPPLDDAPSFDEDDDDEFGTFASVGTTLPDIDEQHPSTDYTSNVAPLPPVSATDSNQHTASHDDKPTLELDTANEWPIDHSTIHKEPPTNSSSDSCWKGHGSGGGGSGGSGYDDDESVDCEKILTATLAADSPATEMVASQDSVSDSGLCSASQFSDGTFVDTSPDDGGGDGMGSSATRSDLSLSPVTVQTAGLRAPTPQLANEQLDQGGVSEDEARPDDTWYEMPSTREQGDGLENDLDDDDDDDDDDFADFAGFEPECVTSHAEGEAAVDGDSELTPIERNLEVEDLEEEEEEEFAEFQDADFGQHMSLAAEQLIVSPVANHGGSSAEVATSSENFAKFEEFRFQVQPQPTFRAEFTDMVRPDDDDDEFGNFDSAKPDHLVQSDRIVSAVGDTLALTFPAASLQSPAQEATITRLDDTLGPLPSVQGDNDRCSGSDGGGVWSQLYDIDSTHALTYRWAQSQSSQKLLRSLHIDSRNLLLGTKWNSAIPLFAATLGQSPLEPTKAAPKSSDEERPLPAVLDTGTATSVATSSGTSNGTCTQENVIPPAQFDWSSSGLVNPLDELESELLGGDGGGASSLSASKIDGGQQQASPLLEQILRQARASSNTSLSQQQWRPPSAKLSAEARAILQSLPDLSFMQAKVLMFPLRSAAVP